MIREKGPFPIWSAQQVFAAPSIRTVAVASLQADRHGVMGHDHRSDHGEDHKEEQDHRPVIPALWRQDLLANRLKFRPARRSRVC